MKKSFIALLLAAGLLGGGLYYLFYGGGLVYIIFGKSENQLGKESQFREAAKKRDLAIMEQLMQEGVNVDTRNPIVGENALTIAINNGDLELVKFLLDNGSKSTWAGTPLDYAIQTLLGRIGIPLEQVRKIIFLLVDYKISNKEQPPILAAIITGNFDKVKEILSDLKGKEIRPTEFDYIRHAALFSDNLSMLKYLIQEIPNLASFENENGPFLEAAIKSNDLQMVEYALTLPNANINAHLRKGGYTPFQMAIEMSRHYDTSKIIEYLIKQGAQLDENYYESGYSPLNIAQETGNQNVIELLQKYGKKQ